MKPDRRSELDALRRDLLRFARLQPRDADAAENAVQETMLRNQRREVAASLLDGEAAGDDLLAESLFDQRGYSQATTAPGCWADAEAWFAQQQFWRVFESCLDHRPEKTARVFMMRELLGFATDEICKGAGISSSNCWVVPHRARLGLRACLDITWFAGAEA